MKKNLVVVESPAKAKTIEKFLGKNYTVRASMGHLRDLPKSQFGVDIEHDFEPKYINIRGRGDIIKGLKDEAKKADAVYLATDPDREGEAIAWHLAHILGIDEKKPCRIEFNEITKNAIQNAIKHPRPLNLARIDAQQARRILDRIVGYKLSPLLWRKVRKGLSAGRVQSVAVRLICDREKEIQEFQPEEYWTIAVKLKGIAKTSMFTAELAAIEDKKASITDENQATIVKAGLEQAAYHVADIKRKERRRNPAPPFTTSSLQQDAIRKLGFTSRKTMMVAQQLYEGLDIGSSGPVGLITYMRTDSTRVAESAQAEARMLIAAKYGAEYLPEQPPVYTKKNSQDAHEAIRPTSVDLEPAIIGKSLNKDQLKLYKLIWERFVASQMSPAVYDTMTVEIKAGIYDLKATGSQLKFAGFIAVYNEGGEEGDNSKDVVLPDLQVNQSLKMHKVLPAQHFTEPPPRYNEATLVKILEEKGIGRPSTYAPIVETILERRYVQRAERRLHPTDLGCVVVDLLKEYFPDIVDIEFTANMENELDSIADDDISRAEVLSHFYQPFSTSLANAEQQIGHVEIPEEVSDTPCENCGRMMVVKHGRYGDFLACPGFPQCRNTKPILKETGVNCPKCQGMIVERRSKRGKPFYGCRNYPQCDYVSWDAPLKENCEACGAFKVMHSIKKGRYLKICSNPECTTRPSLPSKQSKKSDTPGNTPKRRKKSV